MRGKADTLIDIGARIATQPEELPDLMRRIRETRRRQLNEKIANQLTLPLWTDAQRGVPNGPLRSCLFAALGRGSRPHLEREPIFAQNDVQIIYTGLRLDQDYLTLWETLLHLARFQELGDRCEVTIYQLLKVLARDDTGGNRKTLLKQLANLQATAIEIKQGDYTYIGSLVDEAARDDSSGMVVIVLNQKLVALFQPDQFTKLSWEIRQSLNRPLAKWLHGFYSSHAVPYDVSIEFLHKLSGSTSKNLVDFKNQSLIPALQELAKASTNRGDFFEWCILPNGLVRVRRSVKTALIGTAAHTH